MTAVSRLRELLARATPGPWNWDDVEIPGQGSLRYVYTDEAEIASARTLTREDAELIATMRNAVPALLAVVEAARTYAAALADCHHDPFCERHHRSEGAPGCADCARRTAVWATRDALTIALEALREEEP